MSRILNPEDLVELTKDELYELDWIYHATADEKNLFVINRKVGFRIHSIYDDGRIKTTNGKSYYVMKDMKRNMQFILYDDDITQMTPIQYVGVTGNWMNEVEYKYSETGEMQICL